MPYFPTSTTGIHALDETQQIAANKQYSWTDGCAVSLSSNQTSIESQLTAGTVVFNENTLSIPSGTQSHPDGDLDHPRWDAICVTDENGTVDVISGIPAEPVLDQNGVPVIGEEAYKPAPSDSITTEMVCLAIIWIPASATTNGDLSDSSIGGVPDPVIDRRIYQQGQVTQVTRQASITSSGWYRIAAVGNISPSGLGEEGDGLFSIRDAGGRSATTFVVNSVAGDHALTVLNSAAFTEPHGSIHGLRVVSGGPTEGAAVDANVQLEGDPSVAVEYTLQNNYFGVGWEPVDWDAATVPSGYSTSDINFAAGNFMLAGVGQAGEQNSFYVTHDGTVGGRDLNRQQVGTRVTRTSDVSIPQSTYFQVPFDTTAPGFDDYGAFSGNTTIDVPVDGTYLCQTSIGCLGLDIDKLVRCRLTSNGSPLFDYRTAANASAQVVQTGGPAKLAAGDTIRTEIFVNANNASINAIEQTYLSVVRLG